MENDENLVSIKTGKVSELQPRAMRLLSLVGVLIIIVIGVHSRSLEKEKKRKALKEHSSNTTQVQKEFQALAKTVKEEEHRLEKAVKDSLKREEVANGSAEENDSAAEEVGENKVEGESELPAANKLNQTDKLIVIKKDGNVSKVDDEEEISNQPGYSVKEDKKVSENIDNQELPHEGRNSKKAAKLKREFKSKRKSKMSGFESVSAITEYHKPVSYDLGKGYDSKNDQEEITDSEKAKISGGKSQNATEQEPSSRSEANVSSMLNDDFESEISGDDDTEDALQTRTEESSGHLNLKLPPAKPPPPPSPPPPAARPKTEAKSDSKQACAPPNPCGNTMMPPVMINQPGIAGYQQQLPWGGVQGSLMISDPGMCSPQCQMSCLPPCSQDCCQQQMAPPPIKAEQPRPTRPIKWKERPRYEPGPNFPPPPVPPPKPVVVGCEEPCMAQAMSMAPTVPQQTPCDPTCQSSATPSTPMSGPMICTPCQSIIIPPMPPAPPPPPPQMPQVLGCRSNCNESSCTVGCPAHCCARYVVPGKKSHLMGTKIKKTKVQKLKSKFH